MGDAWQGRPIRVAGEVAIPVDYVRLRLARPVPGQVQVGHQCASAHTTLGVDIGYLQHNQEVPLNANEVALRTQPGQVGIKTEQFA
ncbi:hypothetical protein D3C78_1414030 [compost metagenome]